jgi:uncharacterized integral membrane protein (TIGR00698 family)
MMGVVRCKWGWRRKKPQRIIASLLCEAAAYGVFGMTQSARKYAGRSVQSGLKGVPGLVFVILATVFAVLIARFVFVPTIIMALLVGLSLNPFVSPKRSLDAGICLAAEPLMKVGIACLGAGVNVSLLATLGWPIFAALLIAIGVTILAGMVIGRALGRSRRLSILSAGAVAICGSSAALAICCAMPKGDDDERDLSVVIIAVSVLSAAGIVLYPLLTKLLSFDDVTAGFVLGGSLHNVAQAIAAGFSVSDTAGETATLVKMSRVAMLAPLVMVVAWMFRSSQTQKQTGAKRWVLPPLFLVGFLVLMGANEAGLLPSSVQEGLAMISRACLLMAMTAIGLRTSVFDLIKVDRRTVILLCAETVILLALILCAVPIIAR